MKQRLIMHVDMDAFYASVEQADRPELRGLPVIVGGDRRGVVSAASYEARRYGVHSAMPTFVARRKCPNGVFLPVRMKRYQEISRKIMDAIRTVSPLVEQVSIDEAYADLSGLGLLWADPLEVAAETKKRVQHAGGVTCSVGIASLKFLAKIASDMNKPDGLMWIRPEDTHSFLASLPVGKLPGVGAKTLAKLEDLGIHTAGDLTKISEKLLSRRFGKYGRQLLLLASGVDDAPVIPEYRCKSVSAENTFERDLDSLDAIRGWVLLQSERVGARLRRKGLKGRTIVVKLKRSNFDLQTRRRTLNRYTDDTGLIYRTAVSLIEERPLGGRIRLTGVGVTNFQDTAHAAFWERASLSSVRPGLDHSLDRIRERYGFHIIQRGSALDLEHEQRS